MDHFYTYIQQDPGSVNRREGSGSVKKPASPVQKEQEWQLLRSLGGLSLGPCCCILLLRSGGGEELWLNRSHAPLKDYSKALAFNGCSDSTEPITAQTAGGWKEVKDVSACKVFEHISDCGALS